MSLPKMSKNTQRDKIVYNHYDRMMMTVQQWDAPFDFEYYTIFMEPI